MKKNLLLRGPIGCGKSTILRNVLGTDAQSAGGYVTLRLLEGDRLLGFSLAPASALCSAEDAEKGQRFLDFTRQPRQDLTVFSHLGIRILNQALEARFAVADEFGGLELLAPGFPQALTALLKSPVPCIGVIKSREASQSLIARLGPGENYGKAYDALVACLENDPDTEILDTTGRYDDRARIRADAWATQYVRMCVNEPAL